MRFEFVDESLRAMYEDPSAGIARLGVGRVKALRKVVQLIDAAPSITALAGFRALRLEKLVGGRAGEFSVRLNQQWRLILHFRDDRQGQVVEIIEIVDYH